MGNRTANLNRNFKVRNVANTTNVCQGNESWKRVCACRSWMNHWRAGVRFHFPYTRPETYLDPPCYVRGCSGRGVCGAHVVEIDGRATLYWKIVPFCEEHNHHTRKDPFFLSVDAILIPASQVDTCMDNDDWKAALRVVKLHQGE